MIQDAVWLISVILMAAIAGVFLWVAVGAGQKADAEAVQRRAYRVRAGWFWLLVAVIAIATVTTLRALPYPDRGPQAASRPLRHPRVIGRNLPGASMADLLSAHLQFRQQVGKDLDLPVLPPTSYEVHIASLRKTAAERRELLSRKTAFTCAREFLSALVRPQREWLGDYPALASQRNQSVQTRIDTDIR